VALGKATALAFAHAGDTIVISGGRREVGDGIVASIVSAGGRAHSIACDLKASSEVEQLVQDCLTQFGARHRVQHAGVLGSPNSIADETVENYNEVFKTNVRDTLLRMKYQMAHLIGQGYGVIVNATLVYGAVAFAQCGSYVAAKYAIEGLTKVAALAGTAWRTGQRRCAKLHENQRSLARRPRCRCLPIHDWPATDRPDGEQSEVAAAAVFLALNSGSFITEASLPVDGGYLAQ
jgi:NAD(P)-dependent dehydrogenase (short-subunit alcohol dehydrogenase family)